jgi:hypothetical protein
MSTISKSSEDFQSSNIQVNVTCSTVASSEQDACEAGFDKSDDLLKSNTSDFLDKSRSGGTSSSSSMLNPRETDECDDLLSDYTSETTFFDAERSSLTMGKIGV